MDDSMTSYLAAIQIEESLTLRIDSLLRAFTELCTELVDRIFVTDSLDPASGDRLLDSLWGFSESYLMEARDFTVQWNADVSPYGHSISYLGITCEDLEFPGPATMTSKLAVEVQTNGRLYNRLSAIGGNCDYLTKIVIDLFVPNVRPDN